MAFPTMKFGKSAGISFSGMVRSADWTGQKSNYRYLDAQLALGYTLGSFKEPAYPLAVEPIFPGLGISFLLFFLFNLKNNREPSRSS